MITSSADFAGNFGMVFDRNAAAIVGNREIAVRIKLDFDEIGVPGDGLVHRVVDDFGKQVMQRRSSVPPIYMPGRRRTGSSPSRTSMAEAS
jgi:hypothetical protein